jgi:hypothetical protein
MISLQEVACSFAWLSRNRVRVPERMLSGSGVCACSASAASANSDFEIPDRTGLHHNDNPRVLPRIGSAPFDARIAD